MLSQKSQRRMDRGFAIVTVLFVIGVLLVLGTALTLTAVNNSQNTLMADSRQRAYDTAESGLSDVLTGLGNASITSVTSGQWTNGVALPSQQDANESYDYNVTFNNTGAPEAVPDPLTNTGQACVSTTNPGPGCVAVTAVQKAPAVFIAVRGHYGTQVATVEAEAITNDLTLNGITLRTKGDAGTNGNGNIAADPCNPACPAGVPTTHNVIAFTDGSFNGGKGLIDGSVYSVGTADATIPNNCSPACVAESGATPIPFPSSNNIQQQENTWKKIAISQGHYYGPNTSLPGSITIGNSWPAYQVWFVDQSIDLKDLPITNNGGLLIVTGGLTETGNQSAANYTLSDTCNASCDCHAQAQLIDLSTNGVAIHGQGTGKGHTVSQGVLFAPNGPATNIGNGTMQAAIVASSAQIGGVSSMTADTCAAQAFIPLPGYNMTAFGEH